MRATLLGARAAVELDAPTARTTERDDRLVEHLRPAFPQVLSRQPTEASNPTAPYMVLQSTASRLLVSSVQAVLDTRFYDEYPSDLARCVDYLREKLINIVSAWTEINARPAFLSTAIVANYTSDRDTQPTDSVATILRSHLRYPDLAPDSVQDAQVRVALKAKDEYFVNLVIANFENKLVDRPIFGGQQVLSVRPWEGRLESWGVQFQVDINNRLEAISRQQYPIVDNEALDRQLQLLTVVVRAGDEFVHSGRLPLAEVR